MKEQGNILVESILALAVAIIVITGIVVALISSIGNSTFTTNQNLASNFAKEGLDIVRDIKERNYDEFSEKPEGTYCLSSEKELTTEDCPEKIGSTFTRQIYINSSGTDNRTDPATPACGTDVASIFVASTVTWTDSKCENGEKCHKVELNSCLTDLRGI